MTKWDIIAKKNSCGSRISNLYLVIIFTELLSRLFSDYFKDAYYGESCNTLDNIKIREGNLILNIKREKFLRRYYTGATLATKFCFKSGRIEIRAKGPPW